VVSGEVGMAKPDPRIFQLAIERCALDPQRTVYIDDNRANVDAALGAGLDAFQFTGAEAMRRALVERGILS
jgi:2-haloacid dehalogenase